MSEALLSGDDIQEPVSRMSALDLYEDLLIDDDKDDGYRVLSMQEILDEKRQLEEQNALLVQQVVEAKLQAKKTEEEKNALQKNFDSLLATAKVELSRKNELLSLYLGKSKAVTSAKSSHGVNKSGSAPPKKKGLLELYKGRRIAEEELEMLKNSHSSKSVNSSQENNGNLTAKNVTSSSANVQKAVTVTVTSSTNSNSSSKFTDSPSNTLAVSSKCPPVESGKKNDAVLCPVNTEKIAPLTNICSSTEIKNLSHSSKNFAGAKSAQIPELLPPPLNGDLSASVMDRGNPDRSLQCCESETPVDHHRGVITGQSSTLAVKNSTSSSQSVNPSNEKISAKDQERKSSSVRDYRHDEKNLQHKDGKLSKRSEEKKRRGSTGESKCLIVEDSHDDSKRKSASRSDNVVSRQSSYKSSAATPQIAISPMNTNSILKYTNNPSNTMVSSKCARGGLFSSARSGEKNDPALFCANTENITPSTEILNSTEKIKNSSHLSKSVAGAKSAETPELLPLMNGELPPASLTTPDNPDQTLPGDQSKTLVDRQRGVTTVPISITAVKKSKSQSVNLPNGKIAAKDRERKLSSARDHWRNENTLKEKNDKLSRRSEEKKRRGSSSKSKCLIVKDNHDDSTRKSTKKSDKLISHQKNFKSFASTPQALTSSTNTFTTLKYTNSRTNTVTVPSRCDRDGFTSPTCTPISQARDCGSEVNPVDFARKNVKCSSFSRKENDKEFNKEKLHTKPRTKSLNDLERKESKGSRHPTSSSKESDRHLSHKKVHVNSSEFPKNERGNNQSEMPMPSRGEKNSRVSHRSPHADLSKSKSQTPQDQSRDKKASSISDRDVNKGKRRSISGVDGCRKAKSSEQHSKESYRKKIQDYSKVGNCTIWGVEEKTEKQLQRDSPAKKIRPAKSRHPDSAIKVSTNSKRSAAHELEEGELESSQSEDDLFFERDPKSTQIVVDEPELSNPDPDPHVQINAVTESSIDTDNHTADQNVPSKTKDDVQDLESEFFYDEELDYDEDSLMNREIMVSTHTENLVDGKNVGNEPKLARNSMEHGVSAGKVQEKRMETKDGPFDENVPNTYEKTESHSLGPKSIFLNESPEFQPRVRLVDIGFVQSPFKLNDENKRKIQDGYLEALPSKKRRMDSKFDTPAEQKTTESTGGSLVPKLMDEEVDNVPESTVLKQVDPKTSENVKENLDVLCTLPNKEISTVHQSDLPRSYDKTELKSHKKSHKKEKLSSNAISIKQHGDSERMDGMFKPDKLCQKGTITSNSNMEVAPKSTKDAKNTFSISGKVALITDGSSPTNSSFSAAPLDMEKVSTTLGAKAPKNMKKPGAKQEKKRKSCGKLKIKMKSFKREKKSCKIGNPITKPLNVLANHPGICSPPISINDVVESVPDEDDFLLSSNSGSVPEPPPLLNKWLASAKIKVRNDRKRKIRREKKEPSEPVKTSTQELEFTDEPKNTQSSNSAKAGATLNFKVLSASEIRGPHSRSPPRDNDANNFNPCLFPIAGAGGSVMRSYRNAALQWLLHMAKNEKTKVIKDRQYEVQEAPPKVEVMKDKNPSKNVNTLRSVKMKFAQKYTNAAYAKDQTKHERKNIERVSTQNVNPHLANSAVKNLIGYFTSEGDLRNPAQVFSKSTLVQKPLKTDLQDRANVTHSTISGNCVKPKSTMMWKYANDRKVNHTDIDFRGTNRYASKRACYFHSSKQRNLRASILMGNRGSSAKSTCKKLTHNGTTPSQNQKAHNLRPYHSKRATVDQESQVSQTRKCYPIRSVVQGGKYQLKLAPAYICQTSPTSEPAEFGGSKGPDGQAVIIHGSPKWRKRRRRDKLENSSVREFDRLLQEYTDNQKKRKPRRVPLVRVEIPPPTKTKSGEETLLSRNVWISSLEKCQERRKQKSKWSSEMGETEELPCATLTNGGEDQPCENDAVVHNTVEKESASESLLAEPQGNILAQKNSLPTNNEQSSTSKCLLDVQDVTQNSSRFSVGVLIPEISSSSWQLSEESRSRFFSFAKAVKALSPLKKSPCKSVTKNPANTGNYNKLLQSS